MSSPSTVALCHISTTNTSHGTGVVATSSVAPNTDVLSEPASVLFDIQKFYTDNPQRMELLRDVPTDAAIVAVYLLANPTTPYWVHYLMPTDTTHPTVQYYLSVMSTMRDAFASIPMFHATIQSASDDTVALLCAKVHLNHFVATIPLRNGVIGTLLQLYPVTCRINHSCDPNCIHLLDYDADNDHLYSRITSVKTIVLGEEITISYLKRDGQDVTWSTEQRQHVLRTQWLFQCRCRLCCPRSYMYNAQPPQRGHHEPGYGMMSARPRMSSRCSPGTEAEANRVDDEDEDDDDQDVVVPPEGTSRIVTE